MRFLITGGAGFLGVPLANSLVKAGHTVRVLDDLSAGQAERLHEDIHFTRGDVEDKPKMWRLLNKVDCVYHLAARVSVPESILYPREYNATNVSGTVAIMEAMRDVGIKRVVLASSGTIYGEQSSPVVHEAMLPNPTSPYAVSKLAAENYLHTIGKLCNIETVSLRIFNTYGAGQAMPPIHAPVIPEFLRQILGKGSLVVFGNGEQVRDYIHVNDVVDALIRASTADQVNQRRINVGTGVGTTINQLIETIEQVTQQKAQKVVNHLSDGGVTSLVADTRLAQKLLNHRPKISLKDGLELLLSQEPAFKR